MLHRTGGLIVTNFVLGEYEFNSEALSPDGFERGWCGHYTVYKNVGPEKQYLWATRMPTVFSDRESALADANQAAWEYVSMITYTEFQPA